MLLGWTLLYGPTLLEHATTSLRSDRLCDDARIVLYYFYHFGDPDLFTNDAIGRYHAEGTGAGFHALYWLAAKLSDPLLFGEILPYPLLLATAVGIGVTAHRFAGKPAVFVSVALCLGAALFLHRMSGGLPRAFAYPFLAWCAAALALGRVRWLMLLTAAGGLFYPVITVIGGLALAIWLLLQPAADRGDAATWSLKQRLAALAITVAASAIAVAPFMLRMRPYGTTIKESMLAQYPEAGPGGRHDGKARPPFAPFMRATEHIARASVTGSAHPVVKPARAWMKQDAPRTSLLLSLLAGLAALGIGRLGLRASDAVRRVGALAAATAIGYTLAAAVSPSLVVPQRYVQFAVPILVIVALPASVRGFLRLRGETARTELVDGGAVLVFGLALLVAFGGRGDPNVGIGVRLSRADAPVYAALRKLPKSAVVAGWPKGIMDNVPLVTLRTAFLTYETHVPYHTKMTELMRERMRALIEAYFARDPAPLRRLRDEFSVSHLLVDLRHFDGDAPGYFVPFAREASGLRRKARGDFEVLRAMERAVVFRSGDRALLELRRLN
jgi:hypothetical protein